MVFLIICTGMGLYISSIKELQIDEVSTYLQSNRDSLFGVTESTLTVSMLCHCFIFIVPYYNKLIWHLRSFIKIG